jgi:hypothetical protein
VVLPAQGRETYAESGTHAGLTAVAAKRTDVFFNGRAGGEWSPDNGSEKRGIKGKPGEQTGEQIGFLISETQHPCGLQAIIQAVSHHMNAQGRLDFSHDHISRGLVAL